MNKVSKNQLVKKMQKIFWFYLSYIFIIKGPDEINMVKPEIRCGFIPITMDNYHRVGDFREEGRISEYRDKLVHKEIGFFAQYDGKMIGSIWATINKGEVPKVVRTYMRLMSNQGLIHDIVTGERSRGMRVGPYMVSRMVPMLIKEYGLSSIIIDVNIRNQASLRMMDKAGMQIESKVLNVSAFGKLIFHSVLRQYD